MRTSAASQQRGTPAFRATTVRPGLRLAVHGRYNIFFRVTDTETIIVRIVHSARDIKRIKFDDDPFA